MEHTPRRPWARSAAMIFLLSLAAALAYSRVFSLGFVWDDRSFILVNKHVLAGLSLEGIRWAFTSTYHANWQPLTWISCMLDVTLFGAGPAGFHAVNLLLHLANVALLFAALRAMTGAFWPPALVAALFALHPLNVETVAWVTERSALLGVFFGLLALLAHRRHAAAPRPAGAAAVALLLALSLLAKPVLVTLPALLLLLDAWPLGRWRPGPGGGRALAAVLPEKLPLLALAVASSAATLYAQREWGAVQALELIPVPVRLANALTAYARYLGKALWPVDLAAFYPLRVEILPLRTLAAALLIGALGAGALAAWRRRPWLAAGGLWFLGMLVPMIGLVQVGGQSMADRYAYVPLIGPGIALAWTLAELARARPAARAALGAACCVALCALGALTWRQTALWRDELALFGHAVRVTERNTLAHYNLGGELLARGDLAGARFHLLEAIRYRPEYAEAIGNLGNVLVREGDVEGGIARFRQALRIKPSLAEVRVNLGAALAGTGRKREAEAEYRAALRDMPDQPTAHMNLGNMLSDRGEVAEALEHYREALRLAPDDPQVHYNLGVTLAAERRYPEAAAAYREALRLRPDFEQARRALQQVAGRR
jgi:tetratricopeptide (TPR) repeat protein